MATLRAVSGHGSRAQWPPPSPNPLTSGFTPTSSRCSNMVLVPDTAVRPRPVKGSPVHARPPLWRRLLTWVRAHKIRSALVAVFVLLSPILWSLGFALSNPALGSSLPGRLAEWLRD